MDNSLKLIGRTKHIFTNDVSANHQDLLNIISKSRFLVLGGAGSIGQAVVKEIFKRSPIKLHVVDISENNLVELVRDIRSSFGYIDGDFKTFALDIASSEYDCFIEQDGGYDYVLNLSALKHVRSEKDPYTLMRMIDVNIFNTEKTIEQSIKSNVKKYFCVSTDKATNPVNMMGASKRIMELFLMRHSSKIQISTARFANVAFSDGSLMHGFNQRFIKRQPIVAPKDIKRYFLTAQESGELCLMSCIYGDCLDIFFPKLDSATNLVPFSEVAIKFLDEKGFEPFLCSSENEARSLAEKLIKSGKWPCYFTNSDTTGEKPIEEFFTNKEILNTNKYESIGVIKNTPMQDDSLLDHFKSEIKKMKSEKKWSKNNIVDLFNELLPEFNHLERNKNLDNKM